MNVLSRTDATVDKRMSYFLSVSKSLIIFVRIERVNCVSAFLNVRSRGHVVVERLGNRTPLLQAPGLDASTRPTGWYL